MAGDLIRAAAHHPFAETVAAVHGALIGGEDHDGLPVFMLHAGNDRVFCLAAGILIPGQGKSRRIGDAQPADGIVFPVLSDKVQIVGRDANRVLGGDGFELRHKTVGQPQPFLQLLGLADAVGQ